MEVRLNIIYDNRQSDDYQRLLDEFVEQEIEDYHFWNAIVHKNSVIESINSSHKMIVQWAKDKGKRYVIIGEQDLHFTDKGAWQYFLDSMPDEFDIYLGATYIPPISNNQICGFHLYIVAEKFYDTFLNAPPNQHIDTCFNDIKGDYKFCYPFPALQRSGWSFNNKEIVNYNSVLKPEDIWKG